MSNNKVNVQTESLPNSWGHFCSNTLHYHHHHLSETFWHPKPFLSVKRAKVVSPLSKTPLKVFEEKLINLQSANSSKQIAKETCFQDTPKIPQADGCQQMQKNHRDLFGVKLLLLWPLANGQGGLFYSTIWQSVMLDIEDKIELIVNDKKEQILEVPLKMVFLLPKASKR